MVVSWPDRCIGVGVQEHERKVAYARDYSLLQQTQGNKLCTSEVIKILAYEIDYPPNPTSLTMM